MAPRRLIKRTGPSARSCRPRSDATDWILRSAGTGLVVCFGLLTWFSRTGLGPDLRAFAGLMVGAFACYALAAISARRAPWISSRVVMVWAIVFRGLGFAGWPLLEDDYYRYLWDGYRFATDGSPYGLPPLAFFMDVSIPPDFQSILSGINHPDIPTIYGPTFEYVFLISHWIAPGQLWPLQLILIAADLLTVAILLRIAGPRQALLYAWNPLVIKEIAYTAHPDGLMPLLLIAAWLSGRSGSRVIGGLLAGLAVMTKVSAWLFAPFLLLSLGGVGTLALAATWVLGYLPFWYRGAADTAGLHVFAQEFEFNSALYAVANAVLPSSQAKAVLGVVVFAAATAYFVRYRRRRAQASLPRGDALFGGMLLASPVINPWYLLWLLPFASVFPSLTAWTASGAVLLAYVTGLNLDDPSLGPYDHPSWVRPFEFALIGVAFILDAARCLKRRKRFYRTESTHDSSEATETKA